MKYQDDGKFSLIGKLHHPDLDRSPKKSNLSPLTSKGRFLCFVWTSYQTRRYSNIAGCLLILKSNESIEKLINPKIDTEKYRDEVTCTENYQSLKNYIIYRIFKKKKM